ncbi:hypothetical protein HME9304_01284 [Flagellimonas maritima]|uniref:Uncharacterized protein n=1 Tax=Flagellimonas maritima TaxID=1383885 RepID=A0A2Z4LRT4_9FLAO|nr:hypothetical protein [Allomuricauda aurantiaca]AWX44284.1 hypothetical protein HME9304_01284 [Allomuricauda aurantiaca]
MLDVQLLSVATGIGVVTKIKKIKDILKGLRNFTKVQWDEFFEQANARLGRNVADAVDDIPSLIAKWDNLTVTEAKSLYSKLSKTDLLGSKTVVSQSEILAEINASSSLVNPYNFAHSIDDIVLSQEALFVRVHNSWNPNRPW